MTNKGMYRLHHPHYIVDPSAPSNHHPGLPVRVQSVTSAALLLAQHTPLIAASLYYPLKTLSTMSTMTTMTIHARQEYC